MISLRLENMLTCWCNFLDNNEGKGVNCLIWEFSMRQNSEDVKSWSKPIQ